MFASSENNRTYLNRLKLDIRNPGSYRINQDEKGDGLFDFFPGYTIDLKSGEVIFPTLSPFYGTLRQPPDSVSNDLIAPNEAIYTLSKSEAQQQSNPIKFYMGGKATGEASSRYSLGFSQ